MGKFEKISCKLCLKIVSDENYKLTEETIEKVLDILLLKLSVEQKNIPVICNACSTKLFAAFNFKVTCMDTEDCIFPYVNFEKGRAVDLREIYVKEKGKERLKDMLEDEKICRLCMQVATIDFTSVEDVDIDILGGYIPEINFSSTKEPVICKSCLESLDIHTNFLRNCLNVKQKTKNIVDQNSIENMSSIKCEEIEIKSEEIYSSTKTPIICDSLDTQTNFSNNLLNVKQEMNDICDDKSIETVPRFDLVDTPTNFVNSLRNVKEEINHICDVDAIESMFIIKSEESDSKLRYEDASESQTYKCDTCDFRTIYKNYLRHHQSIHKVLSDEQMYRCDMCEYKTTRKRYLTLHQLRHKAFFKKQMYKCDSCDFKTHENQLLKRHQMRHKDIPENQMYKCDSCHYKTRYKGHYTRHLLCHEDNWSKRRYQCDSCDYKTNHRYLLKEHQIKHKVVHEEDMYKCNTCDYKTGRRSCFIKHQVRHNVSKEEMYKCDSCNYETAYKKYLKRHQLVHKKPSEMQMYKCDKCSHQSKRRYLLMSHYQKKHKH